MGDNLSIIDLVRHADPLVQAIVSGLVLCSIVCWAIIIEKVLRLGGVRRQIRILQSLSAGNGPASREGMARIILDAGVSEQADLRDSPATPYEARQRIDEAMRARLALELKRLEGGLTFLATIGSAAPFIGLFGTVWGIMTSFTSIAASKDTSLDVVAPGIAEALFATAAGLAAAIPAVIAYNQIATALGKAAERGGAATPLIARRLVRDGAPELPEQE